MVARTSPYRDVVGAFFGYLWREIIAAGEEASE